ncbi:MAG TPA: dipicolinate synthase subunit B [Clostridiales bacterium]|nr:dipicolinate synthase subunit B [Clostridiales bacterium]
MKGLKLGYAMCGSFCTLAQSIEQLKVLKDAGCDIYPIMSKILYTTDTRFGKAKDFIKQVEAICERSIIHDIKEAEPIGPKNMLDIIVIAPCTGNTLSKLANGITDTPVTMATKAHLRNNKPVVIALATNDALGASAKNLGLLLNTKNIYFVPLRQDDPIKKYNSLVCDFTKIKDTIEAALSGRQLQPVFLKD